MNIKSIGSKIKGNPTMVEGTVYSMLIICSISHFLNDMIQSIIPSIYPIVKDKFHFSFAQIGIITLVFQMTSSILQPFTGLYADKHPRPYALSIGMCFTLVGLLLLAFAENYFLILLAVSVIGLGSSVFGGVCSRSRIFYLPSHGFEGGTDGIRRKEKFGTIHLPGGWQWRFGSRTTAGSHHHPTFRTACHFLVCPCSLACRHHHGKIGSLV